MSESVFEEVIIPIVRTKGSIMVLLTTPDSFDNHISRWARERDKNGLKVQHHVNICEDCQLLPMIKSVKCTHIANHPSWLSAAKDELLKAFFRNSEVLAQEMGGVIIQSEQPAFNKERVEKMGSQPLYVTQEKPRYIVTCADPCGDGPSHLAVCSSYMDAAGNFVVSFYLFIGLEK